MKVLILFLFFASAISANAFEWPEWIHHPFFDSTDNIRNKKVVNHSIGLAYQSGHINITPGNQISTNWDNANSIGIITHATLNFTGRFWAESNGFSTFLFASDNFASYSNTNYHSNGTFGFNDETTVVLGYDFIRLDKFDISGYAGFYKLGLNSYMFNNGIDANIWANLVGGIIGSNLTYYYKPDIISTSFVEMYVTYMIGSHTFNNRIIDYSNNFANSAPALGFGIGSYLEIAMENNFWLKPFAKFQMMFLQHLDAGTSYFNSSGIKNSGGLGDIQILTVGLGISWK